MTLIALLIVNLLQAPASSSSSSHPPEIPLWSAGAPGSENLKNQKEIVEPPSPTHDNVRVHNIHNPSITPFLAPRDKASGTAVIIAPGGGHRYLSIDSEEYNVAEFLNGIGVSAFVLKYRLAKEEGSHYKVELEALADAQRAVRLVRSRAEEWGIYPSHIVIMGFSAGGELAALASTHYDSGKADANDPMKRQSSRFDPTGQTLVSGSDTTVKVWDPSSGKLLRTIEGHTDVVQGLGFLQDGRFLVSKGRDEEPAHLELRTLESDRNATRAESQVLGSPHCLPCGTSAHGNAI